MKNQIYKDKKKRYENLTQQTKKDVLISIYKNQKIAINIRLNSSLQFSKNFCLNSLTSSINRCVYTGRNKLIHRKFKLSRLSFLKLARNGLVCGLTKSSW